MIGLGIIHGLGGVTSRLIGSGLLAAAGMVWEGSYANKQRRLLSSTLIPQQQ